MRKLLSEGLRKKYKMREVVKGVSIRVEQGEIVGLLGPNGAGKTTSFHMIVGLTRPDGGKIFIDDTEITSMPMYKRARLGMSYLPQEPSIFKKLSVEDNLRAVLETIGIDTIECKKRLTWHLKEMNILHLSKNKAGSLSGGERRRLEIARALATKPEFILLDEPFAGIDPIAVGDLQGMVKKLKEKKIGVLISDHNVRETLSICDRAYILHQGGILLEGDTQSIINNSLAKKIYLGENFCL